MLSKTDIRLRKLTEEEQTGFEYALDCIETWTRQIETQATSLPNIETAVTVDQQIIKGANLARAIAKAMRIGLLNSAQNGKSA